MTNHSQPYKQTTTLTRTGDKPSSLGKYGPHSVREVVSLEPGGEGRPLVTVKRRKNGQYVVVEKLPTKHFQRTGKYHTVEQSVTETEFKYHSLKPAWKNVNKNYISSPAHQTTPNPYVTGDSSSPYKYTQTLPPIDLGFKHVAAPQVGSLENISHKPGGGDKTIFHEKPRWRENARPKVASLENLDYHQENISCSKSDGSLERKISPRFGAAATMGVMTRHYDPGSIYGSGEVSGGRKLQAQAYRDVTSKVGSLDNASHVPGGGDVIIQRRKLKWSSEAKVGSLENVNHQPQGGDIYIFSDKVSFNPKSKVGSLENVNHQPRVTLGKIPNYKTEWRGRPVVGSLDNIHHVPRGGHVVIPNRKLRWKAEAKVDSRSPRVEDFLTDDDICKSEGMGVVS